MADSSVERLLEALALKLPIKATRKTVELAFRAAVDAVPKSKLRDQLLLKEGRWIRAIIRRLAERAETEVQAEAAALKEEEAVEEDGEGGGEARASSAAYQGLDGSRASECLSRCQQLLREALVSINPCARGEEAIEGLVSLLPPEAKGAAWRLDPDNLEIVVRMVPLAATAAGVAGQRESSAAWKRFLGLALCAPLHAKVPAAKEDTVKEVAARLGGVLALLACPSAARAALRIGISRCCAAPISVKQLARFAPAALPLLPRATEGGLSGDCNPSRGDLLAVLSGLLFLHLASRQSLVPAKPLAEAREGLAAAVRHFDASPMLPELRRIVEELCSLPKRSRILLKKVDASTAERRAAGASSVLLECLQVLSDNLQPMHLQRLVSYSGLPVAEDEQTDVPAAAARARGDLFFEDIAGDVPLESLLAGGSAAAVEAASHARKRTLGALDNVEDLRDTQADAEDAGEATAADADPDLPAADEDAPSAADLDPELPMFDEVAEASPASPEGEEPPGEKRGAKRLRRRSKGAA